MLLAVKYYFLGFGVDPSFGEEYLHPGCSPVPNLQTSPPHHPEPPHNPVMADTCVCSAQHKPPSYGEAVASAAPSPNHFVQFYESENHLIRVVTNYAVPSFNNGDAVIILARKNHLSILETAFKRNNVDQPKRCNRLLLWDAELLADQLAAGGRVRLDKFYELVGSMFSGLNNYSGRIFAYGEVVDVLCERGDHGAAVELESLWDAYTSTRNVTLMCGYNMNDFRREGLDHVFDQICHIHTDVKPTESYSFLEPPEEQNAMIAMLQQRSKAREAEASRYKATESALQGALSILSARTSESLSRERDEYLTLLSMLPVGVCAITSRDGNAEYFINHRFCEISGLTETAIRAGGWINAVHQTDRGEVSECLRSSEAGSGHDGFSRCEYRFVHPDGSVRWVAGESVANETGYVQTVVDITENKMLEQERLDAVRAAEEYQRMRAAEAEAQQQQREQYVDSLCHELRNPLSGIFGNVELLQIGLKARRDILSKSFLTKQDLDVLRNQLSLDEESLDAISTCSVHQQTVTDDVLNLSKLEFGKVVLKKVNFNPKDTISSAMKMFEVQALRKKIELRATLPVSDVVISADPHRLSQVIINLIANALKFTEHGSITIEYRVVESGEASSLFEIAVCDTGVGLTVDEKAVLFDRFSQPSSTHYSEYGGTGLGLHISKGLVELMGGKIFVESKKGEGSRFVFTFRGDKAARGPALLAVRLAPEAPKPSLEIFGEAAITQKSPRSMKHILIVEDNFINQRVITRLLESEHFSCVVASNGVEALQTLNEHAQTENPIDLIIMDIQMPVMGGIPATIEIRRNERLSGSPRIPIIGLSGNVRTSHVDNALSAGMDAYLIKPVKKLAVLAAIEKWGSLPSL